MGRGESKDAGKAAAANASTDQAMGAQSFASGSAAIGNVNQEAFNQWKRQSEDFAPGGKFAQVAAEKEAAATAGGKGATDDFFTGLAQRTGLGPSTSQMVASSQEAGRQNERDMAAMANQDELQREQLLDGANQQYVGNLNTVAGDYGGYYAPSISGATGNIGHQVDAAKTPSFWDTFGADIAQAGGSAIGAYTGAKAGCWIAAEIFGGWLEPRTVLVREWLNGEFRQAFVGKIVMGVYLRAGRRIARLIRRFPFLRWAFTLLFEFALKKAAAAKAGR